MEISAGSESKDLKGSRVGLERDTVKRKWSEIGHERQDEKNTQHERRNVGDQVRGDKIMRIPLYPLASEKVVSGKEVLIDAYGALESEEGIDVSQFTSAGSGSNIVVILVRQRQSIL